MNRVTISGRLRYPPRITYTQTGACRASLFLAVPRNRGDTLDYVTAIAWDQAAEDIRDYSTVGDLVEIDGTLRTRAIDFDDGNKHYAHDVVAEYVIFPGRKPAQKIKNEGENNNG